MRRHLDRALALLRALTLVRRRSRPTSALRVRLLERAGCGLCAETLRALRRISVDRALEIERVDIAGDRTLLERYALRIPVLAVGERELDSAGLADDALARWFDGFARGSPPRSA